jgi:short-subunit dehydrogenase
VAAALITGASSGIGTEFARQLAAQQYDLILVARREERLRALAAELRRTHSIRVEVLVADLSNLTDIERVAARISELDILDLLINNAGFGVPGRFADADPAKQLAMLEVHVVACTRLSRSALPGMIARGRGLIINVSSLAAFFPMPGSVAYCSTKAYLNTFSKALQAELRGTGVQVQALCPGFTYTEFHDTPEFVNFSRSTLPKLFWMKAETVVAASLGAARRGRVICIPGFGYRLIALAGRSGLAALLLKILMWLRGRAG